jgi:hypothetical protein
VVGYRRQVVRSGRDEAARARGSTALVGQGRLKVGDLALRLVGQGRLVFGGASVVAWQRTWSWLRDLDDERAGARCGVSSGRASKRRGAIRSQGRSRYM